MAKKVKLALMHVAKGKKFHSFKNYKFINCDSRVEIYWVRKIGCIKIEFLYFSSLKSFLKTAGRKEVEEWKIAQCRNISAVKSEEI
jgi:hypothetical protein